MSAVKRSLDLLKKFDIDTSDFVARWSEEHRVYHSLTHIESMLASIEDQINYYKLDEINQIFLHLGAWYHDIVYYPGAKHNEDWSANLAVQNLDPSYSNVVVNMVMATKTHTNPLSFLAALLIDADLAELGLPRYYLNSFLVKAEYPKITNEQWVMGRINFLESFLARATIYFTSWGAPLEPYARQNMEKELAALKKLS